MSHNDAGRNSNIDMAWQGWWTRAGWKWQGTKCLVLQLAALRPIMAMCVALQVGKWEAVCPSALLRALTLSLYFDGNIDECMTRWRRCTTGRGATGRQCPLCRCGWLSDRPRETRRHPAVRVPAVIRCTLLTRGRQHKSTNHEKSDI